MYIKLENDIDHIISCISREYESIKVQEYKSTRVQEYANKLKKNKYLNILRTKNILQSISIHNKIKCILICLHVR